MDERNLAKRLDRAPDKRQTNRARKPVDSHGVEAHAAHVRPVSLVGHASPLAS